MKTLGVAFSAALTGLALTGCSGSGGSNSNVSQVKHTAPVGMWGGTLVSNAAQPATLTTLGGYFVFACGQTADMTQEVQPDSSGHFSVPGSAAFGGLPAGSSPPQRTQFTDTVTNRRMTVTLTVTPANGTPFTTGPYTVTLGQTAPAFQGACPG